MGAERVPTLGEDFATISAGVCGIKPLTAKLILYTTLDDGYGRYFHDIFSTEDRQDAYLVQELGSPTPQRLSGISKKCAAMAREFISAHKLEISPWGSTWKDIALSGGVHDQLRKYQQGELGQRFLASCGIKGSFVDTLVAKKALADLIADRAGEEKIFTEEERASFLFRALRNSDEWRSCGICSSEFFAEAHASARRFVASELGLFKKGAPFVGVTFGWPAKDRKEWHLFGDLTAANIFRGTLEEMPGLFGTACYEADTEVLEQLYNNTWLCVVAIDQDPLTAPVVPDRVDGAYVYSHQLAGLVSCKWIGTLPEVLGLYSQTGAAVRKSYTQMRKECSSDAGTR